MIFAPDGKTLRRLLSRPGCLGPGILSRQKAWQEALRTERGCREARSAMQNRPFGKAEQAVLRLQQAAVATRWASMHCATRQILRKHITKSAKQMCPPSAGKQPGGMGWHRKIKDCSLCPNGESRKKMAPAKTTSRHDSSRHKTKKPRKAHLCTSPWQFI